MRISVCNWSTTEADADQATGAILAAAAAEAATPSARGAAGTPIERKRS
jgi:hypothetical protein